MSKLETTIKVLFILCIIWVYLVILAGGSVRASGAGMGCPDWPLCFGQFIPPTSIDDLPPNWTEFLHGAGAINPEFNLIHTWTEYINRLFGALLGLLTLFLSLFCFVVRRTYPVVFICAIGALLAVCFNGWLGSRVVASDLRPVTVSLHMLGAFVVQGFLIFGYTKLTKFKTQNLQKPFNPATNYLIIASLICLILQIGMGIQIRESIDWVIKTTDNVDRGKLLTMVPWIYYVHRSFSWVIFALSFLIFYFYFSPHLYSNLNFYKQIKKLVVDNKSIKYSLIYLILVFSQMLIGGALNHLGFPLVAQPLHLLVANLLFGLLCWMLFDNSIQSAKKVSVRTAQNKALII